MSFPSVLRLSASLIAAAALAAACDGKSFSPGSAEKKPEADAGKQAGALDPNGTAKPATDEEVRKLAENLSQDLLDKLKTTTSDEDAASIEQEVWDAWLVSGSGTVDILMKRGLEAQEEGDKDLAREMFDRAIIIKPKYAEAWNRRALLFFNDGKYDEAIADLEATLKYEPRHFGAWIGLGMIFESIERPEAALKAYRKALEIHPHLEAAVAGERRLSRIVDGMPL
jgi:tetratricopeptide (TPR) repeat protein